MKVTAETITDAQIRELRDEQASTTPVGRHWSTCVDALSDEWHEGDGRRAIEHNRERAEARARCAEIWNARAGAKQ